MASSNHDLARAQQEIKAVNDALSAGYPAKAMVGRHKFGALRAASEALQQDHRSFRHRVGTPERKGMWWHKFKLEPNWKLYKEPKLAPYAGIESSTVREEDLLRSRIKLLQEELAQIKKENETAETIRRKIFNLSERSPDPPEWTLREGSAGHRGVPVTIWSDWHWGEAVDPDQVGGVNEFTRKIAEKRVKTLVSTTIDIATNHMGKSTQKYPGIIVCLGGDMMTGDIHEDLRETSWATPQQCVNELTDVMAAAIDNVAIKFGKVFLPAVVGNHGRGTLKPRAKNRVFTSTEWIVYCNLERHFKGSKNIQFYISPETDAHFRAYGHRFLLTHGDALGVKGGDGLIGSLGPVARGGIKVGRSEAQIGRDFDTLLMGHWHQRMAPPGIVVNGALIGYNEFARIQLRARFERPSQQLFFCHEKHGITALWPIYLEQRPTVIDDRSWISWQG
jgi:hypothetical protein